MPTPIDDRLRLIWQEFNALFLSEFQLRTPFQYGQDVLPGERYGLIYTGSPFDKDPARSSNTMSYWMRSQFDLYFTFGYASEADANLGGVLLGAEVANFPSVLKAQLNDYGLLYDIEIVRTPKPVYSAVRGDRGGSAGIYIMDADAGIAFNYAVNRDANGGIMEPYPAIVG